MENGVAVFYVTNRYDQGYKTSEAGYAGQEGYKKPDGSFLIRMNSFFAKHILANNDDLSIIRGIIAEKEGVPTEEIRINIEPLDTSSIGDFSDEIESNLGSDVSLF